MVTVMASRAYPQALVIGIAGGTCSGKTTLAARLEREFGDNIVVINQDAYYKDISHLPMSARYSVNFDHPEALRFDLMAEHVDMLKAFKLTHIPHYDFVDGKSTLHAKMVGPRRIIIIEGILVFAVPAIRELCDIRVFVEADVDIRLLRRVKRDIKERGHDVAGIQKQYMATVKPMHDQFVAPSKNYAHLIIPGTEQGAVGVDLLAMRIHQELAKYHDLEQRTLEKKVSVSL